MIEPPRDDEREEEGTAHRVPFGFGVREPSPPAPDLDAWEGNPS